MPMLLRHENDRVGLYCNNLFLWNCWDVDDVTGAMEQLLNVLFGQLIEPFPA
jgi:hypothetical protein